MEKTISNGFFLGKVNTKNNSADRFSFELNSIESFQNNFYNSIGSKGSHT